ncbi:MAG: MjaI family restriction endonuclease [Deltaproteobacteria bacterium]
MKIKLTSDEIRKILDIESPEFPKYVTQILNLANRNAQGTRPKVVGQMSELIKEFDGLTFQEWKEWYLEKKPKAIENATDKIVAMIENFKDALSKIDKEMVSKWVEDLVIIKTFVGLRFQEAILKKGAEIKGTTYRTALPEDESKGIDGYIGGVPVSIKPETYKLKREHTEHIGTKIIYYEKTDDGIAVDYSEL